MHDRLPRVQPQRAGERHDDVVGDGEHDQLHVVDQGLGLGEGADAADQRSEPLAPGGIAGGHGADGPARALERDAQRRPHGAGADDAHHGPVARPRVRVRVLVVARVFDVAVAVAAGRRRVELDPLRLERLEVLGVGGLATLARAARRRGPRPSPGRLPAGSLPRARPGSRVRGTLPSDECKRAVRGRTLIARSHTTSGDHARACPQRLWRPHLARPRPPRPLPAVRPLRRGPAAGRRPRQVAGHPQDPARERAPATPAAAS